LQQVFSLLFKKLIMKKNILNRKYINISSLEKCLNQSKINLLLPFVLFTLCISCKKFIEIPPPKTQAITSTIFADDQSAQSAVVGIYSQMVSSNLFMFNGGLTVFPGLSADEIYNTSPNSGLDPFSKNAIPASEFTTVYNRIWSKAYNYIYQANSILEGIANSSSLTAGTKQQLTGEAKFVRAFCYFYLVNLFGDVPMETSTNYQVNAVMPRTASAQVYQQIISDLQDAQNLLQQAYPTSRRVRPNKWTATSLLARVYLYKKDWTNAEAQSSAVINSGVYTLETIASGNVFLYTSNEAIWQLMKETTNTVEGATFIPSSGTVKPTYALTTFLVNAFEIGDQRKTTNATTWVKSNVNGGITYYYPNKYKQRTITSGNAPTEYLIVFRLAEQFLIRTEARAQLNNISGAQSDLNMVRSRAGLPPTIANDQPSLLTAVEHERQIELFAEWGHRWFDLKRTGRVDSILGVEKSPNWQVTDALYPIPLTEIQANPFLTQNPGY
jgi:hypothetical protein